MALIFIFDLGCHHSFVFPPFGDAQVKKWCARVDTISDEKLNQSLLTTKDDKLSVNFDPLLVRLLRETKYFLLLKVGVGCGH